MRRIDLTSEQMNAAVWEYLVRRAMVPNVGSRMKLCIEAGPDSFVFWVELDEPIKNPTGVTVGVTRIDPKQLPEENE